MNIKVIVDIIDSACYNLEYEVLVFLLQSSVEFQGFHFLTTMSFLLEAVYSR